jgi:alpha-ketoglutarate-dependent taurine dioxygenase
LTWAERNRERIKAVLVNSGAILFARAGIATAAQFEAFARLTCTEMGDFVEESSPRSRVSGRVMTSTDYPSRYPIQLHNEYSYAASWPRKLYFCCLNEPESGGETPIANTRSVLAKMKPATRERFENKGILYVRNYRPDAGVSWQTAFATEDREQVNRICQQANIHCTWRPGDILHTRQFAPALVAHPQTAEPIWFNHAFFFNVRSIEPEAARRALLAYPPDDPFSTNTLFGDGTPIDADLIEELRDLYRTACVSRRWQRGDVLLLDNMLSSHGRAPFKGKREIVVIMADRVSRSSLPDVRQDRPSL